MRIFALVPAGWFSAVTTMDGTQKQPRNSLKQLIWSHEIPILNTRMADYVHPRFSSCLNDRTCLRPIHPKWIARENWAKRSSWVPKKCSFKKCARFTGICLFYWNTRVWAQIMKVQIYLLVWRPRYVYTHVCIYSNTLLRSGCLRQSSPFLGQGPPSGREQRQPAASCSASRAAARPLAPADGSHGMFGCKVGPPT